MSARRRARIRRRRRLLGAALVVVLVGVVAVVVGRVHDSAAGVGLAGQASVSASSVAYGASLRQVVTSDDRGDPRRGWRSDGETTGAWIELTWSRPVEIRRMVLDRDTLDQPGASGGFLSFGDGSELQVALASTSTRTVVSFSARTVDKVRFTVSQVTPGARSVALTRVQVEDETRDDDVTTDAPADGNVAAKAVVSASSPGTGQLRALVGAVVGSGEPPQRWSLDRAGGAWVQLDWTRPRELTTVAVGGSPSTAALSSGTLQFSDGSQLPLGAVTPDPSRPTVVSFMPRVTTSVRLTFDDVSGSGPLTLDHLAAYQRFAPARTAVGGTHEPVPVTSQACDPSVARPPDAVGLVVVCPTNGAVVGDAASVRVAVGPSYTGITASVWPAEPGGPGPAVLDAVPASDGTAVLDLDLAELAAGPFVVNLEATSDVLPRATALLQLYRSTGRLSAGPPPPDAVHGRSLVYREEFDRPLAISRTGEQADYAAAKPVVGGVEDFGDAIFADPAAGLGNVRVLDRRFLRIGVQPRPSDFPDPQGWGRNHVGGLLASARPGGSGFSAQYGYFEARMAAPAAPGTWPAFWMLPSSNLVRPQPAVAEIDAVELYGHHPEGACHSTHEYVDGQDNGVARCGARWDTRLEAMRWHTYGVLVGPTAISFFIDGRLITTAPQVRGGDEPLFFLVDLALGGGWPVDLAALQGRAELYVDYIHVYV